MPPCLADLIPERRDCPTVRRHRMVVEVASHDLPQPSSLLWNRPVHAPSQDLLHLFELRPHAVAPGPAFDQELTPTRLPQMKVKPRKLKVSGLPSPRRLRLSAAKRPNSISRVFSGCNDSANFANRTRISSRKRRASASCSNPTMKSSA